MSHLAHAAGAKAAVRLLRRGLTTTRPGAPVRPSPALRSALALLGLAFVAGCTGDELTVPGESHPSAPPAAIIITVQPSPTVPNTVPLPTQPEVRVQDATGAPVAGARVTVAVASGGGVVSGTTTLVTRESGVAAFDRLSLTGPAGTHTLGFTAGVASATSGPITITPGPPSPAHTDAIVPDGAAGRPTTITVVTKDVSGNRTPDGASVVVSVTGANTATPAVTNHLDGSYLASYTPTSTGTDEVRITLDGAAIAGSPIATTVRAGGASDTRSTLQLSPASVSASTGSSAATVTVTVLDDFGNPIAGATVGFAASGSGNTLSPATATSDASGRATTRFSSTLAGSHTITATVDGRMLAQTQAVMVDPAVADPGQTTAKLPSSGHDKQPTVITVQTRDEFGNQLTSGGSTVLITVSGANDVGPITATDNGDGTYTASYTPTAKGTDHVAITLNGVAISGSPYRSKVG